MRRLDLGGTCQAVAGLPDIAGDLQVTADIDRHFRHCVRVFAESHASPSEVPRAEKKA